MDTQDEESFPFASLSDVDEVSPQLLTASRKWASDPQRWLAGFIGLPFVVILVESGLPLGSGGRFCLPRVDR